MRVAALYDIHGNLPALEAVLEDLHHADVDRVIVLKGAVLFDGPPSQLTAEGISLGIHAEDLPLWLEGLR